MHYLLTRQLTTFWTIINKFIQRNYEMILAKLQMVNRLKGIVLLLDQQGADLTPLFRCAFYLQFSWYFLVFLNFPSSSSSFSVFFSMFSVSGKRQRMLFAGENKKQSIMHFGDQVIEPPMDWIFEMWSFKCLVIFDVSQNSMQESSWESKTQDKQARENHCALWKAKSFNGNGSDH